MATETSVQPQSETPPETQSKQPEHINLSDKSPKSFQGQFVSDATNFWILRPLKQPTSSRHLSQIAPPPKSQLFHRHISDISGTLRPGPKLSIQTPMPGGMASSNGHLWLIVKESEVAKNKDKPSKKGQANTDSGKTAGKQNPPKKSDAALVYAMTSREVKVDAGPFSRQQQSKLRLSSLKSQPSLPLPPDSTTWSIQDFKVQQDRAFVLFKIIEKTSGKIRYQLMGSHHNGWHELKLPAVKFSEAAALWLVTHAHDATVQNQPFTSIPNLFVSDENKLTLYQSEAIDKLAWTWHTADYDMSIFQNKLSSDANWRLVNSFESTGQTIAVFSDAENELEPSPDSRLALFVLRPNNAAIHIKTLSIAEITGTSNAITHLTTAPHQAGFSILFADTEEKVKSASYNIRGEMIVSPMALQLKNTFPFGRFLTMGTVFLTLLITSAFMIIFWRRDPEWNQPKLPEGQSLTDLPTRIVAALFDIAPIAGLVCIFTETHPMALFQSLPMDAAISDLANIYPGLITCGVYILYAALCETVLNGQTLGKKFWGVRVVQMNGNRAGFLSALARNLFKLLEFIAPPLLFVAIFNPTRQRLGDMLARTLVIQVPQSNEEDKTAARENDD